LEADLDRERRPNRRNNSLRSGAPEYSTRKAWGIVNSQKIRSEKLESFNFSKRIAKDYFNQYELGSIDESFAKDLEDRGILFSDLDFESGKKSSTSRK
jgi:hypothetical protein